MDEKNQNTARELMAGAYDLHVHTLPSVFRRAHDGIELVREGAGLGMAGILLKSHYEPTALRAELVNRYSGCKTKAYGGVVLNWPVGGLNVYAVEQAMKAGAKIVWLPTRDAANSLAFGNMEGDFFSRPGISAVDEKGRPKAAVYDIMDVVRQYGGYLATGHISPQESLAVCRAGRARGVNMILTHPEFPRTLVDVATQRELAELGVLIEHTWFNVATGSVSIGQMAAHIREAGAHRCYIATDRGQANAPCAVQELERFMGELLEEGLSRTELESLAHHVPEKVIHGTS